MKNTFTELKKQWDGFKEVLEELKEESEREYEKAEPGKVLDDGSNPFKEAEDKLNKIDDIQSYIKDIEDIMKELK